MILNSRYLLILFSAFSVSSQGQSYKYKFEDIQTNYSIVASQNTNLFDTSEIRKRNISSAYLIELKGEWNDDGTTSEVDTLFIYRFAESGKAISETDFPPGSNDSSGKRIPFIINFSEKPASSASVIIKNLVFHDSTDTYMDITFWKFKEGFDTAFSYKKVYNKAGNLIEEQKLAWQKFIDAIGCADGAFKRIKYQYDSIGRLTSQEWFKRANGTFGSATKWNSQEYINISYPFYGKLIETFDPETHQLQDKEAILINDLNGVVTTTDRWFQVTTVPLEKKSKLVRYITVVHIMEEMPSTHYYKIVYSQ